MIDRNERDALVALIRKMAAHVRPTCSALYYEAIEALAAPAEGGQGAASVDISKLRSLSERIRPNVEAAPWVCEEITRMIDSAGGAKDADDEARDVPVWTLIGMAERCGAVADEGDDCKFWTIDLNGMFALEAALRSANIDVGFANAAFCNSKNTPQPAEGDGAVCEVDALAARLIEGVLHRAELSSSERAALGTAINALTRPAATAVVPDLIADWEVLIEHPDTSAIMRATLRHVVERLKAASPAAPKGGVVDCPSCMGRGYQGTGIDEAPTTICAACDGTGALATGEQS